MRKNKKGLTFIIIGFLCITVAVCWISYNVCEDYTAGTSSKLALDEIKNDDSCIDGANENNSNNVTPDYILNPNMEMPTITEDGNDYIGVLELYSLNIELPIMSECSYPNLRIAPCRYSGSPYLSNMVIAGHNYSNHFGRLSDMKIGDEVEFIDVDGNKFDYTVADIEVLQPLAVKEMTESEWDLTLFTCTIDGANRIAVRCEKN
jgi:sortase A